MENQEYLQKVLEFAIERQEVQSKLNFLQKEAQSLLIKDKTLFDKLEAVREILGISSEELVEKADEYIQLKKEQEEEALKLEESELEEQLALFPETEDKLVDGEEVHE